MSKRARVLTMASGALIGLAIPLITAFVLFPPAARRVAAHQKPKCVRSPVIRVEWFCGNKVFYVNPDGSRVFIGNARVFRVSVHLMSVAP